MFAKVFIEHFPLLPVEDEGRLNDPDLRENFIERVFTLHRYREHVRGAGSMGALMEFHARHKLLIMAHNQQAMREMGKLLAAGRRKEVTRVCGEYEAMLLRALQLRATPKKHTNVLQHMLGYFKSMLTPDEKQEMLEVIDTFHNGKVPLIVPVTLFKHYVRKYDVAYLKEQVYLNPHPIELKLRNHA